MKDCYEYVNRLYKRNFKPGQIVKYVNSGLMGQVQNRRVNDQYVEAWLSNGARGPFHPDDLEIVEG
ncbi:hypothetical protein SIID45300_02413 [Candidatus Magnetaquicoccaceae bacterium FCR-1]|uniref:Uncharacterized protein n=1 Tax=Candidatus Magnetaquiglobus chichijimensis TaxID=3141448 RepID=A0ABQ0CB17_9PROT